MNFEENYKKIVKILIVAFLCCEMEMNGFLYTIEDKASGATNSNSTNICALNNYNMTSSVYAKHQASIRLTHIFEADHICAGALVGPAVVITAAHCVMNSNTNKLRHPSEFNIMLGNLAFGVTHIYMRPAEVAILMLSSDVSEAQTVIRPLGLSWNSINQSKLHALQTTSWLSTKNTTVTPCSQLITIEAQNCLETSKICFDIRHNKSLSFRLDSGAPILYNHKLIGLTDNCQFDKRVIICSYIEMVEQGKWIRLLTGDGYNQNSSIWGILGFLLFTAFVIKTSFSKV